MHKIISKEDRHRIRLIIKSSLCPRNKTKARNELAVLVFQYNCAVINWPQLEINNVDTKTRKLLTIHKTFYKNHCLPRLYLTRLEGGGGLMEFNEVHKTSCVGLVEYVKLNRLSDYICAQAEKQQTRKGIVNSFSNKLPKTGVNYRYHTGKQNRNTHSPNDCK